MAVNHIKNFVLNMVHPINSERNKPTKSVVIDYVTRCFGSSDQELYSPQKIEDEIERLISTGQMIIKSDGLAVSGVIIFEDAQEVSRQAEELATIVFKQLENRSEFKPTTDSMDSDVIEEMINSLAVIIDPQLAKKSRKNNPDEISPKAKKFLRSSLKPFKTDVVFVSQ